MSDGAGNFAQEPGDASGDSGGGSDEAQLDGLGVAVISVLISICLTAFSIARIYVAAWLAVVIAVTGTAILVVTIRIWGRDGWLHTIGHWLIRG